MKGIQLGVAQHVVAILPATVAANQYSTAFNMENAAHVDLVIVQGAVTSSTTIILYESTTAGGTVQTALAFDYYLTATADSDIFSAKTAATSTGIASGTTADITWIVSIDASQLTTDYNWLRLHVSTAATQISGVAVLSGLRYGKEILQTALS